jgi:ATP-dependent helicase HepA
VSMQKILEGLTSRVAEILGKSLPTAGEDWWRTSVIDRLSIQQQRLVVERRVSSLSGLDLAALLRVFDQNWHTLGPRLNLDSQTRNWLKEAQLIRNRWAHLPSGGMRPDDAYRDVDTIYRLLGSLGAEQKTLDQLQTEREKMLLNLAPQAKSEDVIRTPGYVSGEIQKGTIVRLKARPEITGAVLDILPGDPEVRFTVFHGGDLATYYESQVEPFVLRQARKSVEPDALHAALTATQLRHPSTNYLYSLYASRINFVPYQFRPVLKLIQADRPRMLIADEVGVGKTIEAGLILKELQARRELKSVLVIASKRHIWTASGRSSTHDRSSHFRYSTKPSCWGNKVRAGR